MRVARLVRKGALACLQYLWPGYWADAFVLQRDLDRAAQRDLFDEVNLDLGGEG
jgi:hypothetical protein